MAKKRVTFWVNDRLWEEFKQLAYQKHEEFYGAVAAEMEEALLNWIRDNTQNRTKQLLMNKVNPSPKTYKAFQQVKEYLKEKYNFVAFPPGQQLPRRLLAEGIAAVRGTDPRTVHRWLETFSRFKLIKWLSGEVYEVL